MKIHSLDVVAMVLYFAAIGVFGYFTRRTKTFGEFSVGRHAVPAVMVFASLAATIVGPGFSVGFTAKAWSSGYLFYFLALAYSLQVILVGLLFAPRLSRHRDCHSLGDIMRKRYGRLAHFLTGIVSVGLCVGFTAVMGKVGGTMLSAVTGWPLDICLIVVTGTTALLTFTGGVRATIATEGMQFVLFSVVIPVLFLIAIYRTPETLGALDTQARELTRLGSSGMTTLQMFGVVISFLLGEALIPPYANRALSAKSESASRGGFLLAGAFCVVWLAIVAGLGVVAHGLLPAETPGDAVLITLGAQLLPVGVFGLLLAALVAIVMSSQESVLNSGAVAFVQDVVSVYKRPQEKMVLFIAKVATLAFAALAIYFARFAPSIIDALLILYSIWAPTVLVPLLFALWVERSTAAAGWGSILAGGTASLLWQFVLHEPRGVPAILVGILCSIIALGIGHSVGKPYIATTYSEVR